MSLRIQFNAVTVYTYAYLYCMSMLCELIIILWCFIFNIVLCIFVLNNFFLQCV